MRGASVGCRNVRRRGLLADILVNWTREEGVLRDGLWWKGAMFGCGILRTFGDCRGFAGIIVG